MMGWLVKELVSAVGARNPLAKRWQAEFPKSVDQGNTKSISLPSFAL
jgi:hypothetical protein